MAGSAHANRHGHRPDCKFCQPALHTLKVLAKNHSKFLAKLKPELRRKIEA